jgi:hypothetical protein
MNETRAIISWRWKARVMVLLRRTTRPITAYPEYMLNAEEVGLMCEAYAWGWTADEFAAFLQSRDQEAADRVRSTSRV